MIRNQNEYSNAFAKAMEIIADKKIDQAEISSTIQGFIIECKDASIGEYIVQYQDSRIIVYGDPNTKYKNGAKVYIYVPNGDFSQYKIILGTTDRIATDYIEDYAGEEYYDIGENLLQKKDIIEICSYKPGEYIIYSQENPEDRGFLSENIDSIIKNSNYLKIGATIQTNLPYEQKHGNGRYGVKVTAVIKNSATGEPEQQNFYFDSNNFDGNPQEYTTALYQEVAHWVDSINFVNIKKITYYVQGFPHSQDQNPENEPSADIFIIGLSINGSYRLTENERTTVGVILKAKQGYTFGPNSNEETTRRIEAGLRVKMKDVDLEKQNAKVYWFIQDLKITSNSLGFLRQGGLGWRCINPLLLIEENTNSYEYNSEVAINIPYNEVKYARETRFKCVIIYDGKNYNKEFVIINTNVNYIVTLESSTGITNFSYSVGRPDLICRVFANDKEQDPSQYNFRWQVTNNQNITTYLEQDFQAAKKYNDIKNKKEEIQNKIGTPPLTLQEGEIQQHYWKSLVNKEEPYYEDFTFPQEAQKTYEWFYNEYQKIIETYEKGQRVEKNILYNVDLHQITFKSIFRCSCYKEEEIEDQYGNKNKIQRFVGTAVLDIKNSQTPQEGYTLIINNGDQVFLYDEDGTSLHCAAIDEPYKIQDLSFTLWYNGKAIQEKDLNGVTGTWQIPLENTMLEVGNKQYIEGNTLKIDVKNNYDSSLTNNTIYLTLHYKQQVFEAHTNFVFTKEGQNGTNGTKYHFKLKIKNNPDGIVKIKNKYQIDEDAPSFEIEPQLWYNGTKVDSTIEDVHYHTLRDNLNTSSVHSFSGEDTPSHIIDLKEEIGNKILKVPLDNPNLMNIIEAEYTSGEGYKYYADLPIIIIQEYNKDYIVNLKPGSGFKYVTYRSDGTKPSYDNRLPFEVQIQKKIQWEGSTDDIVIETQPVTTYESENFKYQWQVFPAETKLLTIIGDNDKPSCRIIPKGIFTKGNQVNNAVYLKITKNDEPFTEIHIPIHFMLNKYQNRALNDWNGTCIEINETDGYILTPQIGAGKKNTKENGENTFTGITLGTAAASDKEQTGLFAYGDGVRTIFLDADTGNATFGKAGAGQILIETGTYEEAGQELEKPAVIKSSDYSNDAFQDSKFKYELLQKQDPEKIDASFKQGMEIQFSGYPHIRFGSGKFYVEPNGYMYATGGKIANWTIEEDKIFTQKTNRQVGMSAGVYLEDLIDPKLSDDTMCFWAGEMKKDDKGQDKLDLNFYVKQDGYLFSKKGQIGGWTIRDNDLIYNQSSKINEQGEVEIPKINEKIGLRAIGNLYLWAKNNEGGTVFSVSKDGYLKSVSGNIGGWEVDSDGLTYKDGNINRVGLRPAKQSGAMAIFVKDKAGKNNVFSVTNQGFLYSVYGKIGNWNIGEGGLYSEGFQFKKGKNGEDLSKIYSNIKDDTKGVYVGADGIRLGTNFHVNSQGSIYAIDGSIGGCKITNGGISSQNEDTWYIKGGGDAKFTGVIINGASVQGMMTASSKGGFNGGSGSGFVSGPSGTSLAKGVSVDASQVKVDGTGKTLKQWIEDLAVEIVTKKVITNTLWAQQTITARDLYITSRDVYLSQTLKDIWDAIRLLQGG